MAVDEGPFGGYVDVTGVVDATAAAEVVVILDQLKALIPNVGGAAPNAPMPHPDFDKMSPEAGIKLRAEIDAVAAAIAAAPTV